MQQNFKGYFPFTVIKYCYFPHVVDYTLEPIFFFFWLCQGFVAACGIQFPIRDQTWASCTGSMGVLATGSLGKSPLSLSHSQHHVPRTPQPLYCTSHLPTGHHWFVLCICEFAFFSLAIVTHLLYFSNSICLPLTYFTQHNALQGHPC